MPCQQMTDERNQNFASIPSRPTLYCPSIIAQIDTLRYLIDRRVSHSNQLIRIALSLSMSSNAMASFSTTPAAAGASNTVPAVKNKSTPASNPLATKLAKNKRLPATMINSSSGSVDASKKKKKSASRKQNKRLEEGKEKALERSSKLEERVREREERKVGSRS